MFKLILPVILVASMASGAAAQTEEGDDPGRTATPQAETPPPERIQWDQDRYSELIRQSDGAYERAQSLEGQARAESVAESLRLREEARGMLRSNLLLDALDEYGEAPRRDLLNLSQNAVALLLQLDRCDEAEERLDYALGDALLMPDGAVEELRGLRQSIGNCRARIASAQEPAVELPAARTPAEPTLVEAPRHSVAPWILIGTGGAMLVSALAYDIALDSDRNEFQIIQNECRNGCSADQHTLGVSLQDELDRAKIITGVLYGAGLAASVVGVVLLFTRDDEPERQTVALTPAIGPGGVGATMSVQF